MLTKQHGGERVRDVMTAQPSTAPESITVTDFLVHYVMSAHRSAFPIVDPSGRVTGLVTLGRCIGVPAEARDTTPLSEIAWQPSELTIAHPDEELAGVLTRARGGDARVLVYNGDDLVGIVTPSDVARTSQRSGPVRR